MSDVHLPEPDGSAGAGWRLVRIFEPPREPVDPSGSGPRTGPGPSAADGPVARLSAAAFDPGRRGVRLLAVVAVVVVVAAAALAWWSRPRAEPVVPQLATTSRPVAPPSEPAELVVAVSGQVEQPGLVRLPPGARVADAIEAAGGPLPEADLAYLNLARKVADGELITVGLPPPPGGTAGPSSVAGKINLNTATAAELETLPGIGPALAQRIIAYRTAQGPFRSVEQLTEVSGIGEARFAEIRDQVTV